jgi:hypothetical protein
MQQPDHPNHLALLLAASQPGETAIAFFQPLLALFPSK